MRLHRDIAQPYTLRVIMDIYGVPESDEALMLELTQGLFGSADPSHGRRPDPGPVLIASVMKFIEYFGASPRTARDARPTIWPR